MPKGINYGTITLVDRAYAFQFADKQIARMKCKDPEVIEKVCSYNGAGGGNCLTWVQDKTNQNYPTPTNYFKRSCVNDNDCTAQGGMGTCVGGKCRCGLDSDCKNGMACIRDPLSPEEKVCAFVVDDPAAGHCVFNTQKSCMAYGELPYTCDSKGYCTDRKHETPTDSKAY